MAGLAGSRHLDAVDAQLGREVPQHVGLLQAGLVVQRVSHGGGPSETWGGWLVVKEEGGPGREKSPLAAAKTGSNSQPCYQPKFILYKSW